MTIKVGVIQSAGAAINLNFDKEVTAFLLWNETKFATDATNVVSFWTKGYAAGDASIILNDTTDGMKGVKEETNGLTATNSTTLVDTGGRDITGITQANPAVVTTSVAHGFSIGDTIKITDVYGMPEINGLTATIALVPSATTFTTNIDASGFSDAGTSGLARKTNGDSGEVEYTKTTQLTLGTACAGADNDILHYIAIMADEFQNHGDQA
jgi:hypothetical protein